MSRRLATSGPRSHPFASLLAAVATLVVLTGVANAEVLDGVQFPDRTTKVGERRYRVPQDWENTMKYFKAAYPSAQYPRHMIVNQPGVKAVHLANPDGHGGWVGLNIYETSDEVRVYVVPPDAVPGKTKKQPAAPPKKK